MPNTKAKEAAPKKRFDKKVIRSLEKVQRTLEKVREHIKATSKRGAPNARVDAVDTTLRELKEHLRDEKAGWVDLPSKKERKAAKRAAKKAAKAAKRTKRAK